VRGERKRPARLGHLQREAERDRLRGVSAVWQGVEHLLRQCDGEAVGAAPVLLFRELLIDQSSLSDTGLVLFAQRRAQTFSAVR
jgi:hypothetical protein